MSYLKISIFVSLLTFLCSIQMEAQLHNGCTDPSCTDPWQGIDSVTITTNAPECDVTVYYEYRICNGTYEYRYVDMIASGNCTQMDDFSIYHYDISSLLEMVDMIIAEEVDNMPGHPPVPSCPNTFTKVKIYSASCGVWVKCSYIIDTEAEVKRDRGYTGDCPVPDQDGYIDKWKWQSCGETCCRREYDICWYESPVHGQQEIRVTQHPAIQIGQCDDQGQFGPWEDPNTDYQCEHSCNL